MFVAASMARVLIVADDPLARAGLAALLADRPECTVVGQVVGTSEVPAQLDIYRPDIVLWDLGWTVTESTPQHADPRYNPSQILLEYLTSVRDAGLPVIVLLQDATHATAIWNAGVRCLVLRNVEARPLVAALQGAMQGLVVLDPVLAMAMLPHADIGLRLCGTHLTRREHEVLQLVAEGLPNKTIAGQLQISEHTVKFHVNAIMSKLGAQSRTDAVVRATRLGLLLL